DADSGTGLVPFCPVIKGGVSGAPPFSCRARGRISPPRPDETGMTPPGNAKPLEALQRPWRAEMAIYSIFDLGRVMRASAMDDYCNRLLSAIIHHHGEIVVAAGLPAGDEPAPRGSIMVAFSDME